MRKSLIYILFSGFTLLLLSCHKEDNFEGTIEVFDAPKFDVSTPTGQKVKQMYDTYNVLFKPTFELEEYTWNWDAYVRQNEANSSGMRYTPAKNAYVNAVIDSIEKWVFHVFPKDFSKQYMPLNILLTDSLVNKYSSGGVLVPRIYEGNIANNYIVLSYVSERFDEVKGQRLLPESWLSLFVEKMLSNFPAPTEFAKYSTAGYAKIVFTNAEDVRVNYALLKKGRTKQNSGTATAAWNKTTIGQDFGDFVAFIVYTPDAQKETIYALNPMILQKVKVVKEYFKTNFSIELPYLPIAL